jgi:hypothetical protein
MSPNQYQPNFEYATLEWIWEENAIRVNLPDGREIKQGGSYKEVVYLMTQMGHDRWEVVSCVGVSNWLFWTLKRLS